MPSAEQAARPATSRPDARRHLLIVAIVLTGLTMRIAVSSVGAVLDDLEHGLHASSGLAGLITSLPVIAFAGIGIGGPRLARRFGEHRLLVVALLTATAGLVLRAVSGSVLLFAVLSMLALTGGAIANVLMPALVKRHFPDRIGTMTAAYTTSLAIGTTAGAGLTVPLADVGGHSWRVGIGAWAVLTGLAVLPWLATLRSDAPAAARTTRIPLSRLARSKLAWSLAIMFGSQSMQAYIGFGWFTNFFRHNHVDSATAGLLVAFYAALSIPVSVIVPTLAVRHQRALVVGLTGLMLTAYLGMFTAPVGGAWVWMLLAGVGAGTFPLTLTMIGLRSREVATTVSLSAFAQSIGYLLAGSGPLLVGVLLGISTSWTGPLLILIAAALLFGVTGWYAARPVYVDDDLN